MNLKKFFEPNFRDLLLVLSGVVIGITPLVIEEIYKYLLFGLAVGLILLAKHVGKVEAKRNEHTKPN